MSKTGKKVAILKNAAILDFQVANHLELKNSPL